MALKKSDLYSALWKSCDELRGGMDASQYKDYVLTLLFVKYVSDKAARQKNYLLEVPEGGSFADMVALRGDKEIGDKMNKIVGRLAEANDLKGTIDLADFNDEDKLGRGKELVDRLGKLIAIFEGLDLGSNRAGGDDLLGDAYEYLMRHFATESGKSKGQFYTPAEVSRIMAKVIGISADTPQDATVYDPTCGSGSLLLKAADQAARGLTIYGQEMDNTTAALARMNMILHDAPTAVIWRGNTLASPHWTERDGSLRRFDFAVSNPPFSYKGWTSGLEPENDEFGRFTYGVPPTRNGDYAFFLHLVASLKSTGRGAIIMPHGVLFRGYAEANIRRSLLRRGLIQGIIGLPVNLFYGTGIPACIVVVDKEDARERDGVFMIDASRGYVKDGNKNRLREQDIHRIVDVFTTGRQEERYSRLVPLAEIEANDYNLNLPRYINATEPEDIHDLDAHLNGGIPDRDIDDLDRYWQVLPGVRSALFRRLRDGYSECRVPSDRVRATILEHPEFAAFSERVREVFDGWRDAHRATLLAIDADPSPRQLIHDLSEDLLDRFDDVPLLDPYDLYQRLMDYWHQTMQDDVYLLVQDGWHQVDRQAIIPAELIIDRYFPDDRDEIKSLEAAAEDAGRELEEFVDENTGEDGLIEDAKSDAGNVGKTSLRARLREVSDEPGAEEEVEALEHCQVLMEREAKAKKKVKKARMALVTRVLEKYADLAEVDFRQLVVDRKWIAAVRAAVVRDRDELLLSLASRIEVIEERYDAPLPDLTKDLSGLEARVADHLSTMGYSWS